jgi:hypothetical protein
VNKHNEFLLEVILDLAKITANGKERAKGYECLDFIAHHGASPNISKRIMGWSEDVVNAHFPHTDDTPGNRFFATIFEDSAAHLDEALTQNPSATHVLYFVISKYSFPITDEQEDESNALFWMMLLCDASGSIIGTGIVNPLPELHVDESTVH